MFDTDLLKTFEEMEELLDELAEPLFRERRRGRTRLPVNLYEGDQAYTLEMPLPGVDPQSLEVDLEGNVLTVSGERPEPEYARGDGQVRRERRYGKFRRRVRLPREVERDGIEASYRHGLLTITLPKPRGERRQKIQVKVG